MKITFDWLEEHKYPSVTDLCRELVREGDADGIIEVYRNDMLCLTVTDIKAAATIMSKDGRWSKFDKTRRKAFREPRGCV